VPNLPASDELETLLHEIERTGAALRASETKLRALVERSKARIEGLSPAEFPIEEAPQSIAVAEVLGASQPPAAATEVRLVQGRPAEPMLRDPLTGLYNRAYLEETLARELISAKRRNQPISLIMGDLDGLQTVNESFGTLAGDELLRNFAGLFRVHVRGSDICCRYGDEEFLAVLPQLPKGTAIERADQLRSALAAKAVQFGPSQIATTASFGVAAFPNDGLNAGDLIAAASTAMYAAKSAGRNRVKVSGSH